MDQAAAEFAIKALMAQVRARINDADGIVKAAKACIEAGNPDKGIEIALDMEQPLYEASRLLDAASLIKRISRT